MSLVEDIKREISWDKVDFFNGYYRVWLNDPREISKLRQNSNTFWLDLGPNYVDMPISIIIQNERYLAQYYTFNGKPHRPDGPAQIITNGHTMIRKWYRNGSLFNPNGPTYEKAVNISTEELENGIHCMTMDSLIQTHHTAKGPGLYPRPNRAEFTKVMRIFDSLDHMVDCQGRASFMADTFTVNWTYTDTDAVIIPRSVNGRGLVENRNVNGKVTKRKMHSTVWAFNDGNIPLDVTIAMKIGTYIVSDLAEGISFNSDFYISPAYEIAMSDYYKEDIIG